MEGLYYVLVIITAIIPYIAAMEFPAIILVIILLLKAGRRLTLLILYLTCSLALLSTMAVQP